MKGLGVRLALTLAAASSVGLLVVDLAYVFAMQARFVEERRQSARKAALEVALAITSGVDPAPLVAAARARDEVLVSIDAPPPPPPFEHERVALGAGRAVIAAYRRGDVLEQVFAAEREALLVLGGSALLSVGLGLVFVRRHLLAPLTRMTELVARDDEGLAALDDRAHADDLRRLGRAILGMRERIADDKAKIAAQLLALTDKNRELALAQHDLVRAERLAVVGQLAAGLAHEVGNPLAVLQGFLDVLDDEALPPARRAEAVARMRKELDRIHGTLRALLDFSRVPSESGAAGNLGEALAHVRGLVLPQDKLRGVSLRLPPLQREVRTTLSTDALTQVLLNLLLNAADAVERKGEIALSVEEQGGRVVVHVDDSGKGVAKELRERIFEPFFTTKPPGAGTGLGLSVCERLVSAAGGDLSVGDGPLGGARFTLSVPAPGSRARRA